MMSITVIRIKENPSRYLSIPYVFSLDDAVRNARIEEFSSFGTLICGCRYATEMDVTERNGRKFFYTKSRNGQQLHEDTCRYGRGGSCGYLDAITDSDDGTVSIKVEFDLALKAKTGTGIAGRRYFSPTRSLTKGKATLLGFLEYLWESAGLHVFHPGMSLSYERIRERILNRAKNIKVNKWSLSDVLWFPSARGASQFPPSGTRFALRLIERCGDNGVIYFAHDAYPRKWSWPSPEFDSLIASYGELPKKQPSLRLAWALMCMAENGGKWTISKIAWLPVHAKSGIPIESGYELQMCEKLVSLGRSFYKPLRFDYEDSEYHADFVLTDNEDGRKYPIEVWGMDNDLYNSHREEKEVYYDKEYGTTGWLGWSAITNQNLDSRIALLPPCVR